MKKVLLVIIIIVAFLAICGVYYFFHIIGQNLQGALLPSSNANTNISQTAFVLGKTNLSNNDFVVQDTSFSNSILGKSWCNDSYENQTDILFVNLEENPSLVPYINFTYVTIYVNGKLPSESSYYSLYGRPPIFGGAANMFTLQPNLKVNHPNNIKLCFQINDTEVTPSVITNRVCLDSFNVSAEC